MNIITKIILFCFFSLPILFFLFIWFIDPMIYVSIFVILLLVLTFTAGAIILMFFLTLLSSPKLY